MGMLGEMEMEVKAGGVAEEEGLINGQPQRNIRKQTPLGRWLIRQSQ